MNSIGRPLREYGQTRNKVTLVLHLLVALGIIKSFKTIPSHNRGELDVILRVPEDYRPEGILEACWYINKDWWVECLNHVVK